MDYFERREGSSPVLLHVPHSSINVPEEFRADIVLDDAVLTHEAQWMADLYTDELYLAAGQPYSALISGVSRLVVDVERYEDESLEAMSEFGMAAVYTKTSSGDELKHVDASRKEEYLNTIFRPYHKALGEMVKGIIDTHGHCVIVDCHSFPSQPRYYEDQTPGRPDICIGTSKKHTPGWLRDTVDAAFSSFGYSVQDNTPFAGTIIPNDLATDPAYAAKISSVMIELNRKCYMNENTFERGRDFEQFGEQVRSVLETIAAKAQNSI